jgi:hypothetical protein
LIACKLLRVVRRGEDTVRVESSQCNLFIIIISAHVSILKKKKTKTKKTKKKKNKHVLYLNFLLFQDERRLLHVSFEHCFLTDWALAWTQHSLYVLFTCCLCANRKRRGLIIKYA